jgi:uncharacterized protein YjbI with pentapeptide repeats
VKFPTLFSALFLAASVATAIAKSQNASQGLSPTEEWVFAQVTAGKAGKEADLVKQFPAEKDRKLSAHFLEELLTGTLPGVKLHRNGVRILGATIDESIDLENAQILCEVRLKHCQFNENVTFDRVSFAGNVSFSDSAFRADASFNSMKVGGDAFFRNAVFEGPVDFVGAHIASAFEASGAQFQDKKKGTNFNSMKVEGYALFNDAVFEGPVDFVGADIASAFQAMSAKFQNKKETADFKGMKVRGYAFFNGAVFEGPVDFRYADFVWLELSGLSWSKVADQFHMQGMSYKYIRADEEESESHKALLTLADQSAYGADVYSNLEEFFLRQGYRDDADRAFIAGKSRERKENLHGLGWVGSWLLYLLVGYGRHPSNAGYLCVFVVGLGFFLFSREKMELQKSEDAERVYNRFWYSLGLFLPFVNLQAAELWKPKTEHALLRNYVRVHILLGWVLIPIVLAALTGFIK